MKILVVGSSNIDMVAQVEYLPTPGQTVGNGVFMQAFGGKGANQAVAAARLGGDVTFVSSLGNDMYSKLLIEHFGHEKINTEYIQIDNEKPTGTALIMVSAEAENCIAVTPGANGLLLPKKIAQFTSALDNADMLVMQAEIPYETTKQLALLAKQKGVKVLLNPAPACAIDPEFLSNVDILVVNETEAELISLKRFNEFSIEDIAQTLLQQGAQQVLITLGSKGLYLKTKQKVIKLDAFKVKAIDTTAAGDTFCGALAVACACKEIDEQALRFASAAAAISVTRLGAQPAIPTLTEVEYFLQKH